ATKLAGTCLVRTARAAGLDAVVLRVFNAVGAGMPANTLPGRVAAQLRTALRGGGEVRLGSLDTVRDFVDIRDIADAALAAALALAAGPDHIAGKPLGDSAMKPPNPVPIRNPSAIEVAGHRPMFVIPAYFHPLVHPEQWEELIEHARQLRLVVLNPASGPGRL